MMPTNSDIKQGLVQDMRPIKDQISNEIKDMWFEQEHACLDKLLSNKTRVSA